MLTPEELERMRVYVDLIKGADGSLEVLTREERQDLEQLLEKWLAQSREQPPSM